VNCIVRNCENCRNMWDNWSKFHPYLSKEYPPSECLAKWWYDILILIISIIFKLFITLWRVSSSRSGSTFRVSVSCCQPPPNQPSTVYGLLMFLIDTSDEKVTNKLAVSCSQLPNASTDNRTFLLILRCSFSVVWSVFWSKLSFPQYNFCKYLSIIWWCEMRDTWSK
jgi:hypothetical protein